MQRPGDPSDSPVQVIEPYADPTPAVENPRRLRAVRRLRLLDAPAEETFDRVARIAQVTLAAPVVLVSIVDEDRQFFTTCLGLPQPWSDRRETPLSHSFCQYAVATGRELVVEDARQHPTLASNLAIPDLSVIAYAGIPIRSAEGEVLGTFCAIDVEPRRWTEAELQLLRDFAATVADLMEARLALLQSPERQAVLAQVVDAQEQERRRIAAEIHDDTIQTLVAVSLRLQVLAEEASADHTATTLGLLATAANDATDRLRRLVNGLRPTGLDRGALSAAIAEHLEVVLDPSIEVCIDIEDHDLPPTVTITLFRMVQEGVANARAHSGAARLWITVRVVDGGAELHIRDDGQGFTPESAELSGHFGLTILRERAQLLGGVAEIHSAPGEGTELRAWLPL